VARLDLRDPGNLAVARPLIDTRLPWPPHVLERWQDVMRRIGTHGTIERTVSTVEDDSVGASGSVRAGYRFGGGGKVIRIHKRLVEATAHTGGSGARERFDCTGQG
jgi:hypothetical protein